MLSLAIRSCKPSADQHVAKEVTPQLKLTYHETEARTEFEDEVGGVFEWPEAAVKSRDVFMM